MVAEAMAEGLRLLLNAATKLIGPKVGIVPDTLRTWITQAQVDAGSRPGMTTEDGKKTKLLESEVRELKRADAILRPAAANRRSTGPATGIRCGRGIRILQGRSVRADNVRRSRQPLSTLSP